MIHALFAMLLFTVFALGGLVIDVGFARFTSRQMTHATDSAAMEGVRLEDAATDAERREAAAAVLEACLDDDLGATGPAASLGAGPDLRLTGGQGDMLALQRLEAGPTGRWSPQVELNLANARHGDMVAGRYDLSDDLHVETPDYERSDFDRTPADDGEGAFLVRLRRTNDDAGLDEVDGESSRGEPLPYLFGRGSLMAGETRQRGITVRSTSIAAARRATMVGVASDELVGASPFLLLYDWWNGIPSDGRTVLHFGDGSAPSRSGPFGGPPLPNPNPTQAAPPIIPPGQLVGATGVPFGMFDDRLDETRRAWSIGDEADPREELGPEEILLRLGSPDDAAYVPRLWYVPIYDTFVEYDGRPGNSNPPPAGEPVTNLPREGVPRVVGFGLLLVESARVLEPFEIGNLLRGQGRGRGRGRGGKDEITDDGLEDAVVVELVVRKLPTSVAPWNASSVSTPGLAMALSTTLLQRLEALDEPLRAAARVR